MDKNQYLDRLIESGEFRFDKLEINGVDNTRLRYLLDEMIEGETSLFHRDVLCGDDYFEILHSYICEGLAKKRGTPVARFADGEYAFYENSLHCNGLYEQAESIEAISKAMPIHKKALRTLSQTGKIASVIYPGNIQRKRNFLASFFCKPKGDDSALKFLDFLFENRMELTNDNYVPFFVVYAYLTSKSFASLVDGKKICIVNSECNMNSCIKWFERLSSHPDITFAEIPESYVATRWETTVTIPPNPPLEKGGIRGDYQMKEDILNRIPPDTELCLVGAGVGGLLVCVDVAHKFSIPALDAGHVLNMMNDYEDKSNGPRLYTIWKS